MPMNSLILLKFVFCRGICFSDLQIIVLFCLLALTGCGSKSISSPPNKTKSLTNEKFPAWLALGMPTNCSSFCTEKTLYYARAALGIDPTKPFNSREADSKTIFQLLSSESKLAGGSIQPVAISQLLDNLEDGPISPVVLVHENEHLYLLLGSINIEDQVYWQLLHGNEAISLIADNQILNAGFREAWRLEKTSDAIHISVGYGKLQIDKLFHNFGEVKDKQELRACFLLKNVGDSTLVLGKPQVSCSCTSTNLEEKAVLEPLEEKTIETILNSNNSTSQKQSVRLAFYEKGGGKSKAIDLVLFANRRKTMIVSPHRLDFGVLNRGESSFRTVSLSEVATDRFQIRKIVSEHFQMSHEIKEFKDSHGLRTYCIGVNLLNLDNTLSGKHEGDLTLLTDSRFRPEVKIPIKFEVARSFRMNPSIVSLGAVKLGELHQAKVRFHPRECEKLAFKLESKPPNCTTEFIEGDSPELSIAIKINEPGIWQDIIKFKVKTCSGEEIIELKCVGYGK